MANNGSGRQTGRALGRIEFGGVGLPPQRLRDLLQAQVDASPPGSRIDWATYYFRDRALAQALVRAQRRGVAVSVVMEPKPRRAGANDAVIAILRDGLGSGLHLYKPFGRGRLHSKIYAFSEPEVAWIGSFNPSGDTPEDPAVVTEIGDQDRGDNLLLGIERPKLVQALRAQVARLGRPALVRAITGLRGMFAVRDGDTTLFFYPRPRRALVEPEVARLGPGGSFQGAISHLKRGAMTKSLKKAARRGAQVHLLVHDTERRVPSSLVADLQLAGVDIRRVVYPDNLPMHAKFVLLRTDEGTRAWVGSYNYNSHSRGRNAEVLLRTEDAYVVATLAQRFAAISAMASAAPALERLANPPRIP